MDFKSFYKTDYFFFFDGVFLTAGFAVFLETLFFAMVVSSWFVLLYVLFDALRFGDCSCSSYHTSQVPERSRSFFWIANLAWHLISPLYHVGWPCFTIFLTTDVYFRRAFFPSVPPSPSTTLLTSLFLDTLLPEYIDLVFTLVCLFQCQLIVFRFSMD